MSLWIPTTCVYCHIISRHYWLYLHLVELTGVISRSTISVPWFMCVMCHVHIKDTRRYIPAREKHFIRSKAPLDTLWPTNPATTSPTLHHPHPPDGSSSHPSYCAIFLMAKPSADWELRVNGWLGGRLKWKDGLKVIRAKRRKGDPQRPAKPQSRRRFNEAHLTVIIHLQQINSGRTDRQQDSVPFQSLGVVLKRLKVQGSPLMGTH